MGFQDVFKKSFLEGFTSMDISAGRIMATFAVTCILACYIFLIYRLMTRKSFYSKGFNVSLAALSVITAAIILAMQSNLVISLGMVGALSIVRFRTAIKDPMDLLFLFWSIGTGIICGAGLYKVAVILAVMVTLGILVLDMLPVRISPYLLIINADSRKAEAAIQAVLKEAGSSFKMKSKNLTGDGMDLILEVRAKDEGKIVDQICELPGIRSCSLLAHDGDVKV